MGFLVIALKSIVFLSLFNPLNAFSASQLPVPLTLGAALDALDAGHPVIDEAQADLSASHAQLAIAKSAYYPELTFEARFQYIDAFDSAINSSSNDSRASLLLRQKLYDFGRSSSTIASKKALLQGNEYNLTAVRQQQRILVMRRFYDAILSDLSFAETNEAMSVAFIRMDRSRDRQELGQLSDIDLLDTERMYQQKRLAMFESQADQRRTRIKLATSLNRPNDLSTELVRPTIVQRNRPPLEDLLETAMQYSPYLHQLRKNLQAARATEKSVRSERWPVLRGEIKGSEYHRKFGSRTGPFSASLIFEMPLLDLTIHAKIAERKAQTYKHKAILAKAELDIHEQLTELWLQIELLKIRQQELEVLAAYQELYLDRSRALYDLDVTSNLGDSMTRISAVNLQQARAEFDLSITWARVDALTGTQTHSPTQKK